VTAVCWRCIEDDFLKEKVRDDGTPQECSLCKRTDANAFGPVELAGVLEPVLHDNFLPYSEGAPLSDVLKESVIRQTLGFEEEIVDALKTNEKVCLQPGQEPFFSNSQMYVEMHITSTRYFESWNSVLDLLKHRRRFFNGSAKELFTGLFAGVENRICWAQPEEDRKVVWDFVKGSALYRARICSSAETKKAALSDPFKNVGPPPPECAHSGRMNPEGVPVFYGSLDWQTCVAETRPAIGNITAVIMLETTKALRLLDFRRLGKSYARLSYFQPDYADQCEKGEFLGHLQWLISQPIVPGRESDYIITQTLAEYLAHVHEQPFDGILFDSVQRKEGTNIVLFSGLDGDFPLSYVENSVTFYSTHSIDYDHTECYVDPDGEVTFGRDYEEEEW
jgi:hypothetical protein